jgi:pimeloyl-ACP methyl ester carboxylesterase
MSTVNQRKGNPVLRVPRIVLVAAVWVFLVGGCVQHPSMTCPRVVFLDGAGWPTGDRPVREGLTKAGYPGPVERFGWSMMLGPLADHVLAGPDHPMTNELAGRLTDLRRANPDGQIVLMGLSSGCTIIVYALEKLTADVKVDEVVFLSASTSTRTDLREALTHVRGRMCVTINPHDPILAVGESSGPQSGEPAGRIGFQAPEDLPLDEDGQALYSKIEYILWRPEYGKLGWQGGHTGATAARFIETVIGPKVMPKYR